MPEGPSLVIAKEAIRVFEGKKLLSVSGSAKIDLTRLKSKKLLAVKTWGKHLLLCFDTFTVRVHFLMFGSYLIDDRKDRIPKLSLTFAKGRELNFYTASVVLLEEPLDEIYDWTADLLNAGWDPAAARKKLKGDPEAIVADVLLDQAIFAGSGNIIKNEVLYRIKVHPLTQIGDLPPRKLTELITEARTYSHDFLKWKKENTLKKHWLVYTKKKCPRDNTPISKEYMGKGKRRTFFCEKCQVRY